jgi:hypothetical protein
LKSFLGLKQLRTNVANYSVNPLSKLNCQETKISGGVNSLLVAAKEKPRARKVTDRKPLNAPATNDDDSDGLEFMDVKQGTKLGEKVTFAKKFGIGSSIDLKRRKVE